MSDSGVTNKHQMVLSSPESVVSEASLSVCSGVVVHHTGEEGEEAEKGPGEMRPLEGELEGTNEEQPEVLCMVA